MPAPVVRYARDLACPWWADRETWVVHRLVVPAEDWERVDELPRPEPVEEWAEGEWRVVPLDGQVVEVLDLATRKRWRVRRAACDIGGPCSCAVQAWPVDYEGEVPEPDPFDAPCFYWSEAEWDAIDARLGVPAGELPWPELVAAIEGAQDG